MSIYCMLVENNFQEHPDFLLRGFFHEQSDTVLHQQEFCEVVFIINGSGKHCTPHGIELISRGDILLLPEGSYHGYDKTKELKIFNLIFVPGKLPLLQTFLLSQPVFKQLFAHNHEFFESRSYYPRMHLSNEELEQFIPLLANLESANSEKTPGWKSLMLGYFIIIITKLCNDYEKIIAPEAAMPYQITRAAGYINNHYQEQIYLEDLAKLCSMSKNSLLRNFKKSTGCTPMDYLLQIRLSNACLLLINSSLRIGEVAEKCGFVNPVFFSRVFRKKLGCTPKEYRENTLLAKNNIKR